MSMRHELPAEQPIERFPHRTSIAEKRRGARGNRSNARARSAALRELGPTLEGPAPAPALAAVFALETSRAPGIAARVLGEEARLSPEGVHGGGERLAPRRDGAPDKPGRGLARCKTAWVGSP